MSNFVSLLSDQFDLFVRHRKACLRWNEISYGANLALFDKYCRTQFPTNTVLNQEMVDSWCHQREMETNNSCISRIYVIVTLVRFLRKRGFSDVSEPPIPAAEKRAYVPHPFSTEELLLFFEACDSYKAYNPKDRNQLNTKYTLPVFFRLLYSTGMRTTEARQLRRRDVNLDTGAINIVNTKGYEQHYVMMHDTMNALMSTYDDAIEDLFPGRVYFFPNGVSGFHNRFWVQTRFKSLWEQTGAEFSTAYELRHNYAVENINKLIDKGMASKDNLVYLSKSMGHTSIDITAKYYYSIVPVLGDIIREQTEAGFNELVPEAEI